jgi:hypothetical protein
VSVFRLYEPDEVGPDGYPPEWHERIKHEARVLAGDRCVRCLHPYASGDGEWSACDKRCKHEGPMRVRNEDGALVASIANGQPNWHVHVFVHGLWTREAQWRILTVHHLGGPTRKFDCRWHQLVALCQRCHLEIQGKVNMEQLYPFEHSDWFKVYAAGHYAAKYEGRDITRAEAEARLDELLAYERLA